MVFILKKYIKDIIFGVLIVVSLGISSFVLYSNYDKEEQIESNNLAIVDNDALKENEEQTSDIIYVDVKGAVKKPGVYNVNANTIINDVIKLAGGFKSNAYKTNINLSKKVSSEMVIYVYTKNEYAKTKDDGNANNDDASKEKVVCKTPEYNIDNCLDDKASIIENGNDNSSNKNDAQDDISNKNDNYALVNINVADVKALTGLTGVGESKALAIIDYRNKNGNFKDIQDIMNVSGIGSALFEKIKDYITI